MHEAIRFQMSRPATQASRPPLSWLFGACALLGFAFLGVGCTSERPSPASLDWNDPALPFAPRTYAIQRAPDAPQMDGRLAEAAWRDAAWTAPFVHNRGRDHATPSFRTRAKMMWDDRFLYIGAELEEPHVRADFVTRDTTIWRENALELFIDPDGDTHHYYEFQTNARGTIWDLMLTRPYRDGGQPVSAWDLRGMEMGIDVQCKLARLTAGQAGVLEKRP